MQKKYFEIKSMINSKEIKDIISISKNMGTYQKSVQYSIYCYMMHLYKKNKKYESVHLVGACILLGSKISNFIPKMSILLDNIFLHYKLNLENKEVDEFREEIVKLELQMSISLDFKFDLEDQYIQVKDFGDNLLAGRSFNKNYPLLEGNQEVNKRVIQSLWIFMNDSLLYPFRLFFDIDTIFKACIYLSFLLNNRTEDIEHINIENNEHEVMFVAEEMLTGYEKNMKK